MEESDPFATNQPPAMPTPPPQDELPPSPLGEAPAAPIAQAEALASPGKRFLARLVDGLVFLLPAIIISFIIPGTYLPSLVLTLLYGAYEVVMISNRGQTIGKMALSIKVVDETRGTIPDMQASGMRFGLPGVLSLIPVVGWIGSLVVYLAILWRERNQGFHDLVAKTIVVDA